MDHQLEDEVYHDLETKESSSKGGKRTGGRAKAMGRSSQPSEVQISRALSRLLRHQASRYNITLDAEGYAPLDKVMAWQELKSQKVTWADIQTAINENSKQRFALKPAREDTDPNSQDPADWLIRANQGHSIKLGSSGLLKPLRLDGPEPVPSTVVHGTFCAFWPTIVATGGLKPMGRNHVHFATGLPEDFNAEVISGMRRDAELLIYVDIGASLRDGMEWWLSDNGVVLTEGNADGLVPIKYFTEVVGRKPDIGTLWKNGEWVADLPTGIKWYTPQGKHRNRNKGKN